MSLKINEWFGSHDRECFSPRMQAISDLSSHLESSTLWLSALFLRRRTRFLSLREQLLDALHFTDSQLVPIDSRELSCQYRMENLMRRQKSVPYSKQHYAMLLTLLALAGFTALFVRQGIMARGASSKSDSLAQHSAQVVGGNYLYYTVKQSSGFVLARAAKGSDGQPLSMPLPIAQFGNAFGQSESDAIFSMQLSPDSHYVAI